jgi:capsular exopolysaccharide synthesis family protein
MSRSTPEYRLITEMDIDIEVSEAYKRLRTSLEVATRSGKLQTVMITSAHRNEGKSTIAANLAVAFAQAGKRVLLIDADIRGSCQHLIFNTSNEDGISTLLNRQSQLRDAAMSTLLRNLELIPAGPVPSNPSEILASVEMADLLTELKLSYDLIFIDTPPVLSFADSQIVAAQCDGVLLVVNSGGVKQEALIRAKAVLEIVNARILGVVLNHKKPKKSDQKLKSYSY